MVEGPLDRRLADRLAERILTRGHVVPWSTLLAQHTADCESVMDLGSGRGDHSVLLARQGRRVTWSTGRRRTSTSVAGCSTRAVSAARSASPTSRVRCRLRPIRSTRCSVAACSVFRRAAVDSILPEAFRVARTGYRAGAERVLRRLSAGQVVHGRSGAWMWGGEIPSLFVQGTVRACGAVDVRELTVAARQRWISLSCRWARASSADVFGPSGCETMRARRGCVRDTCSRPSERSERRVADEGLPVCPPKWRRSSSGGCGRSCPLQSMRRTPRSLLTNSRGRPPEDGTQVNVSGGSRTLRMRTLRWLLRDPRAPPVLRASARSCSRVPRPRIFRRVPRRRRGRHRVARSGVDGHLRRIVHGRYPEWPCVTRASAGPSRCANSDGRARVLVTIVLPTYNGTKYWRGRSRAASSRRTPASRSSSSMTAQGQVARIAAKYDDPRVRFCATRQPRLGGSAEHGFAQARRSC